MQDYSGAFGRRSGTGWRGALRLSALAALCLVCSERAQGQSPERLPFSEGEQLIYRVRVAKMKASGRGSMRVEGPADVRGTSAYVLRFDFSARLGPLKAMDHTTSWLDPVRMAALRFRKQERHPLSSHDEAVELFPDQRTWRAADGTSGESTTDAPLDELSFIYFLRTLALTPDTVYRFDRHFDAARNPTTVRVVRRETISTPAGDFPSVLLEMRVKDPRRYRGEGVIRIHLSDDARRLPVRIQSVMPKVGSTVLTLESATQTQPQLARSPWPGTPGAPE